ncbi:hypothetical protein [Streptobacillus canis]|uniref:hypothetical protein n=1 Tax=Streptobacillus canis TaxID=2678686 RepID=UPI0012E18B48|nr:hypothetical protein [Streptobacillus canis]
MQLGKINFLERKIPFAFIAFFSKNDKSDKNINKKPRIPGSLFVLLFVILSLKYSTPALLGLYEHPDKSQNLDNKLLMSDWRVDIFKYLYSLIVSEESEKYLFNCFKNMKNYYFDKNKLDKTYSEFSKISLNYMEDSNFENKIILDIKNEKNTPFFSKEILNFIWKPKKISDYLNNKFKGITFFQLSKNCKAGITFETKELIDILNVGKDCYIEDFIKDINQPTVILPIKLTKMNKKKNKREFTDDPYNGEISAFTNLYAQSFPGCNIMIILLDHSNNNEYIVESAKGRKIYKSIHKYVDLVIDLDLNYFSRESENVTIEKRGKYEKEHTTEDSITSFFRTILTRENIKPSFINPPSGSWSDIKLYPTDRYYYYNRDDERGDIAFFNEVENTYYVGESKEKFGLLYKTLKKEYEKTLKLSNIIKSEIDKNSINNIQYKTFAIFKGNIDEAKIILDESLLDHVIIVDDEKEEIILEVIDKE